MTIVKPKLHKDWIDPHARRIIEILQKEGFQAYLVGGCVRDLMVEIHPKDFDIATNASPQQVRKKVPNAYIIGRRFKLVLAKRGDQQFEIATFRRSPGPEELIEAENQIEGDNFFGTSEEDAKRRDFTINALFYDPITEQVLDFVNAMDDIKSRTLRMIGNPKDRLIEDPIRILRAVRLSHKINFRIDEELLSELQNCSSELTRSVLPRRREEWLKFLRLEEPRMAFMQLYDLGILKSSLPHLEKLFENKEMKKSFFDYLYQCQNLGFDLSSPVEVFSYFLTSYLLALNPQFQFNLNELAEDPDFNAFIRDELGMFKQEMMVFFRALEFIPALANKEGFLKRGERRQIAFLQNEIFSLALRLSQLTHQVPSAYYYFWLSQIEKFQNLNADKTESQQESTGPRSST